MPKDFIFVYLLIYSVSLLAAALVPWAWPVSNAILRLLSGPPSGL